MSKCSRFVSWRHTIEQELSSILFLIASHLLEALMPRIFQHKIFQTRLSIRKTVEKFKNYLDIQAGGNGPHRQSIWKRKEVTKVQKVGKRQDTQVPPITEKLHQCLHLQTVSGLQEPASASHWITPQEQSHNQSPSLAGLRGALGQLN